MPEYLEESKKVSRRKSIEFAVKTLTVDRNDATIARPSYVKEVYESLKKEGSKLDKEIIDYLENTEIHKWETFYNSLVKSKSPSELKVAYLSGANPINDLNEFVRQGIIPENVYAFESENAIYDQAIIAALNSDFPFIKIYKGKIENYFKILQNKYDIIYLDFCGTLTSRNTISVLRELFLYQKLNSPGVLITNFSLPQRQKGKDEHWDNLIAFTSNYLFPKPFTEELENYGGGVRDSASVYDITQNEFLQLAFQNPNTFYSQTITRMLLDLPSLLIPYQRFYSNKNIVDVFFKNFNIASLPKERDEDIYTFPNQYPLIWGLNNFYITKNNFNELITKVQKQIAFDSNEGKLLEVINLMSFFLHSHLDEKYNSTKLNEIEKRWKFNEKYIFCDVFLFHQLKELLIGQLTTPYLYNIGKTKRWTYKAKTNRMFVDAITYDECRYIFDWMPTLDMCEHAIDSLDRQLTLRFALDSISKQRRWYNDELFMGTAVIDQNKPGFEAKELQKRIKIN